MIEKEYRKAELLLSSLSDIDDEILEDAIGEALRAGKRTRQTRPLLRTVAAIAAALTVVLSIRVAVRLGSPERQEEFPVLDGSAQISPPAETVQEEENAPPSFGEENETLGSAVTALGLLLSGKENSYPASEEAPRTDDGIARLVWQLESDPTGTYRSCSLSQKQYASLLTPVGKEAGEGRIRDRHIRHLWIVSPDGLVFSPYLKPDAGNLSVSYFEYSPEILPSEEYAERIERILG